MQNEAGKSLPEGVNPVQHTMLLSRLHWPVTVLGHGKRAGIWFQGCSLKCKGCCSLDTWAFSQTKKVPISNVLAWLKSLPFEEIDGVTISGGEPFQQPESLNFLVQAIRDYLGKKCDIIVYSGYTWKKLHKDFSFIFPHVDMLISEPYHLDSKAMHLRGSDNQQLHLLSPLAKERYSKLPATESAMQVHFDGQSLWMIGIPQPGELTRIQKRLEKQGIKMKGVSWEN